MQPAAHFFEGLQIAPELLLQLLPNDLRRQLVEIVRADNVAHHLVQRLVVRSIIHCVKVEPQAYGYAGW